MSTPKRYTLVHIGTNHWMHEPGNRLEPAPVGVYIAESDYAALAAERDSYKHASDEVAAAFLALPKPHNEVARVCEGIAALAAENERLKSVSEAWKKRRLDYVEAECIKWSDYEKLKEENDNLRKANDAISEENERLRKAIIDSVEMRQRLRELESMEGRDAK